MYSFYKQINSILRALKNGDKRYEKILYETTYNHLVGIAKKYAIDKNDCEDIVTEAFYKAFKYINSYDLKRDGYNWLCKIVQNVAYNYNKDIEPAVSLESLVYIPVAFLNDNLDDACMLDKELNKLSRYEKQLIYLRFWEGLSYGEIANKLNRNKSTVHKQVQKIIDVIKNNLEE